MERITGDIILDLDGTLWDSSDTVAKSWTATISAAGNPMVGRKIITRDDMRQLMGMTMDDIAAKIFETLPPEPRRDLMQQCMEQENNYIAENGAFLYDGVEDTLAALSESHRLYIVSNCQNGYIETFFEVTKFERYFSDYLCYGDTGKQKSYTIQRLMNRCGSEKAVYVGDTRSDYLSAMSAGIGFVHAAYGFGKLLPGDTPLAVAADLKELCDIF